MSAYPFFHLQSLNIEIETMTPEKALNIIAGQCSKKEHCSKEVREKLQRWEIEEEAIDKIMAFLCQHKFIDDTRYARIYTEDKLRFNHWGKQKIGLMLRQKGISPEIIAEALNEIDHSQYKQNCLEILKQKWKTLPHEDAYKMKGKLVRFALGRGFSYDTINHCMEQLFSLSSEEDIQN